MFFSGFLMAYTYKEVDSIDKYKQLVRKKIVKFLPPYFLFSLLFFGLEFIVGEVQKENLFEELKYLLFTPSKSPAGFLWYIYVLFQYYALLPLLMRIAKEKRFFSTGHFNTYAFLY